MSFLEGFKLALQSLWGNKLRSILTLIGVVMGVASVIMVITLVKGANRYVSTKLSGYGADVFTVIADVERDFYAPRNTSTIRSARSCASKITRRCGTAARSAAKWAHC